MNLVKSTIAITIVFLFISLSFSLFSFSQTTIGDANANFNDKNYDVALKQYLRLIRKDKNNEMMKYRIGICYLNTDKDKAEAVKYLEKFASPDYVGKRKYLDISVYYDLAKAYLHAHEFDKALRKAEEFKKLARQDEKTDPSLIAEVERFKEVCNNARELIKSPLDVTFNCIGKNVNTARSEYNPFVAEDESFLIYTSNKRYISDFQELVNSAYISKPSWGGNWGRGKSLGTKVNTDEDEIVVGVADEGNTVLLQLKRFDAWNDIYYTNKKGRSYRELQDFGKNVNSKEDEGGACLTPSGDTLFFASNRPLGYGGFDIYYSVKLPNGEWGIPQNAGPGINTPYDDNFPNLVDDGKTLYFASKGYNSMGGYDIFITNKSDDGKWSAPKNIGYPLNDTYDNTIITYTKNKRYAFISSVRKEGIGDRDIYKVIFNEVEKPNIVFRGYIAVGDSATAKELSQVDPEITITVYNITDINDEDFEDAEYTGKPLEDVFGEYSYIRSSGNYIISLPPGKYVLRVEGDFYKTFNYKINILEKQPANSEIIKNIFLYPKTE